KNLAEFTSVLKTTEKSKRFLVKALRGKDLRFFLVKMDRGTSAPETPAASETTEADRKAPPHVPPAAPPVAPGASPAPPAE
ncbi:MAG: hypothetical protein Q8Q14_10215, partial [Gemmatimonadales bacterium]|nr:hypothetical protein [Gemmatimonadales bacterium]